MPDLIMHVGLHKTGTTTIQQQVLAGLPNFLGKERYHDPPQTLSGTHEEDKMLHSVVKDFLWLSSKELQRRTDEWVSHVQKLASRNIPEQPLLISNEIFTEWRGDTVEPWLYSPTPNKKRKRKKPMPLARFLGDYLIPAWGDGQVKVVITLRNQPEWLASLYAQQSDKIRYASQKDFEQQVANLISAEDPFLDWDSMVEEICSAVGRENVCVLLHEDMHQPAFWEDLISFMEIEDSACRPEINNTRLNVRKSSSNQWELMRPATPTQRRLKYKWPKFLFPLTRSIVLSGLRKFEPVMRQFIFANRRGDSIELNEEIVEKIRNYVKPFNARLSQRLNRDLTDLGY